MPWKCFVVEPCNKHRHSLRRYSSSTNTACPGRMGYHDAEAVLEDVTSDDAGPTMCDDLVNKNDPRYPPKCSHCDYVFVPGDHWQENKTPLWTNGTGFWTIRNVPVGALWKASWFEDNPEYMKNNRDQPMWPLCVRTPAGDWMVDGPASNGDGWSRTGAPPLITASPSINFPGEYHGWLQNGFITDDCEGHTKFRHQ